MGDRVAARVRHMLDHASEDVWLDLLGRMSGSPNPASPHWRPCWTTRFQIRPRTTRSSRDRRPSMVELTDNAALRRFEMVVDRETAFVSYAAEDDQLVLVHTEVPLSLAGRGVGSALARAVLDEAQRRGQRVAPRCEFICRVHPAPSGVQRPCRGARARQDLDDRRVRSHRHGLSDCSLSARRAVFAVACDRSSFVAFMPPPSCLEEV